MPLDVKKCDAKDDTSLVSASTTHQEHSRLELAVRETRAVNVLRAAVMLLLITTAALACVGVYVFTKEAENVQYDQEYEDSAVRVIEAFLGSFERKLASINSLSVQITAYAVETNKTFPFVTVPNFEIRGADVRIISGSPIIHWMPLVTSENRAAWEEYAMENRFQINEAFERESNLTLQQDESLGLTGEIGDKGDRMLLQQDKNSDAPVLWNETILQDGTGYHPKIWSLGAAAPRGDLPENYGPHLPLWQRSPVNMARQALLNMDWAYSLVLIGVLGVMEASHEAVMGRITFPVPAAVESFRQNLEVGQFRHDVDSVLEDPLTFVAYPVFDSFGKDRQVRGILASGIYWKKFFEDILRPSSIEIVCVLENSFNQTFSYLLDGPKVTYLGSGDKHNPEFDDFGRNTDVNSYVERTTGPETRSYTAVSLNKDFGNYKVRIYPAYTQDYSHNPWLYTIIVASVFAFTSLIFIMFTIAVEKRQQLVMRAAVQNYQRAATTAQELNEFLSHEVRNPLSAAIAACTFIDSAIQETSLIASSEFKRSLQDDLKIISSSLSFVADFLRSMLDFQRAARKQMELKLVPTDVLTDVLEPVGTMFFQRDTNVEVIVDCPRNLVVNTDGLRLKQAILNLGRNSAKFVESGFIRFRADVVNGKLEISVEDSGPGIPIEKREDLFQKFQVSLDVLNQGTGIGLNLSKMLVDLLGGALWLDEAYDSGIEGSIGARFVIRLDNPPQVDSGGELGPDRTPELYCERGEGASIANSSAESTGQEDSLREQLPKHMSVLFVDDDRMLRKLFVRGIKRVAPEWTIQEAANGETAIRLVDTQSFDMIFMDQYMASTEKILLGTETVRALRSKGVSSRVIGLSANDMELLFMAAGADSFIQKPLPCGKEELTGTLLRIINQVPVYGQVVQEKHPG